ncbi:unnamed protein product [Didymodactylos carnosus]|uniref:BED-type domain-containing protein n=1 Tax=Didymodactylos carnosus TaxID=1234261 RepID=A0A816BSP0_9BILA|nr:unnamed protein product [Didymodactylos carnosus]CAF1613616.1 unnamed protein product [Didymodactylos carnosus]CAF4152198.1 unnamed protein product [Didymodactylos carnosus]CAF4498582.1 unnamed protein product [Didymodactylos carnosus]
MAALSTDTVPVPINSNNNNQTSNAKNVIETFFCRFTQHDDRRTSAECKLCHKVIWHHKGVTSNYSRHGQRHHKNEFEQWSTSLKQKNDKQNDRKQPKIDEAFNRSTKYGSSHPRQIEITHAIVNDMIIDLGLPLSIIERPAFIRAMNIIDPKYKCTSR